jgi:hypothetical protein
MSFSTITIPAGVNIIPVDTRLIPKVLYLPTVSTNAARLLYFKDYFGTSSNSTITFSTTGTDTIDDFNFTYTFSSPFGSMSFLSDGLRSWRTMALYDGSLISSTVQSLPYTANIIVDLRGANYSAGGSTWINSVDGSTWTMTNTTYDSTNGGPLFNGSSSFAYRASLTSWSGSTLTIICYYYKSSTATDGQVLTVNRTGANITNQLWLQENTVFDYSSNFGLNFSQSTTTNSTGVYMFALVKNGATGTFYRNGSANGTQTAGINVTIGNADFCIGKDYRDNNRFLAGTIKRYVIYNIALTASDISNIYSILTSS